MKGYLLPIPQLFSAERVLRRWPSTPFVINCHSLPCDHSLAPKWAKILEQHQVKAYDPVFDNQPYVCDIS